MCGSNMMFNPFDHPPDLPNPYAKPPYQKSCKRTHIENQQCSACRVTLNKNKICYNRKCERFAKEPERR